MKWLWRSLAILVVLAAGFWLWQVLNPSSQKVIRARLQQLAREVTFTPGEGELARLGKVSRLPGYCTEEVEVEIAFRDRAGRRTFTHEMILAAAAALRQEVPNGLNVEFLDQLVTLQGNASAVVELTMKATTPGDDQFSVQEMKFALTKTNDLWLIYRVETVRTLK